MVGNGTIRCRDQSESGDAAVSLGHSLYETYPDELTAKQYARFTLGACGEVACR